VCKRNCGRTTQYLFRIRVCEGPIYERWKSGSVSENAFVGVERPGSVDERIGFAVRLWAERNWNCGLKC
jgi:hypothetical protein